MNSRFQPNRAAWLVTSLDLAGARLKDAFAMRPAPALNNQLVTGCFRGAGRFPDSTYRNGGRL